MDDPLDGKSSKGKKSDTLDQLGERVPRNQRRRATDDLDDGPPDLDSLEIEKRDTIRRQHTSEMDRSLTINDGNWKTMNTQHMGKDAFSDSGDSFMEDSFAGSSFANSDYSFSDGDSETVKALSQFTELDDDKPPLSTLDSSAGNQSPGPGPRRRTPHRSYSKQRKTMPKKSDPLMAITEDADVDNDSGGEE